MDGGDLTGSVRLAELVAAFSLATDLGLGQPNGQHFDANPLRLWYVTEGSAVVEGENLGPAGPLAGQAHMAGFYIPQRGIFAMGRVFVPPD